MWEWYMETVGDLAQACPILLGKEVGKEAHFLCTATPIW